MARWGDTGASGARLDSPPLPLGTHPPRAPSPLRPSPHPPARPRAPHPQPCFLEQGSNTCAPSRRTTGQGGRGSRIGLQRQRARLHHAHRTAPRPAQPPCPASAASTGRPPPIRFRDLRHFTVAPLLEQCVDLAANKELIDHAPHRRHRHRLRPCPAPPPARRHRLPRPRPRLSLTYVRQRRRTPRCPPPLPSTTAVNPARSPDT